MGWTPGMWPIVGDGSEVQTKYFEELRTELLARTGEAVAPFTDGDSTWNAIRDIREGVRQVLLRVANDPEYTHNILNPNFDPTTGKQWANVGQDPDPGTPSEIAGKVAIRNVFEKVFGYPRLAWRNLDIIGEAPGPLYWPPVPPADTIPRTYHLNELYYIINELGWYRVGPVIRLSAGVYLEFSGLQKLGNTPGWGISKQAALEDAYTDTQNYVAQPADVVPTLDIKYWRGNPTEYWVGYEIDREWCYIDIPVESLSCKLALYQIFRNYFIIGSAIFPDPLPECAPPPTSRLICNVDTVDPRPYSDLDWGWGVPSASFDLSSIMVRDGEDPVDCNLVETLAIWVGGGTDYMKFTCHDEPVTLHQYVVDDGYWEDWVGESMTQLDPENYVYLLYKIVLP